MFGLTSRSNRVWGCGFSSAGVMWRCTGTLQLMTWRFDVWKSTMRSPHTDQAGWERSISHPHHGVAERRLPRSRKDGARLPDGSPHRAVPGFRAGCEPPFSNLGSYTFMTPGHPDQGARSYPEKPASAPPRRCCRAETPAPSGTSRPPRGCCRALPPPCRDNQSRRGCKGGL